MLSVAKQNKTWRAISGTERGKFGGISKACLREQVTDPPVGEDVVDVYEEPLIYNLTIGHEE